ncbi:MAG: hypothetical protein U0821_22860 [Chloroflexota bacterium]
MDDRAALLALPKEQLVDIILAQRETIARLEALVVQLTVRGAELEAKIDELTKPPVTPGNSNLPPFSEGSTGARSRPSSRTGPSAAPASMDPSVVTRATRACANRQTWWSSAMWRRVAVAVTHSMPRASGGCVAAR